VASFSLILVFPVPSVFAQTYCPQSIGLNEAQANQLFDDASKRLKDVEEKFSIGAITISQYRTIFDQAQRDRDSAAQCVSEIRQAEAKEAEKTEEPFTVDCPGTLVYVGGRCVDQKSAEMCGAGKLWDSGSQKCVTASCEIGYELYLGKCTKMIEWKICPDEEYWADNLNRCIKMRDCPSGQVFDETRGMCVCQGVRHPDSGICVQYCPFGYKKLGNLCEKISGGQPDEGDEGFNPLDDAVDAYIDEAIGGCLIATATYGSELSPQVQELREIRDNSLLQTESGSAFMKSFNQFYYSFSPTIADLERENPVFKEIVKLTITPLLSSLSLLNYVDMDSEVEVLGYGISMIMLNIGMYFVAPAIVIHKILERKKQKSL